jgi:cobaltochelatase CobS
MQKPIILATNINELEKGQKAADFEISVGVLPADLMKDEPIFYAYRQGTLYNPKDGFSANRTGAHSLPDKLHESYFNLLNMARKNLNELRETFGKTPKDAAELTELRAKLELKQNRIDEQTLIISELRNEAKKGGNDTQVEKLEKMIETLSAIQSNRIEIKIGNKATKVIEKVVHEAFKEVLTLINEKEAVYMYGPAGTGKSELAKQVAEALEFDFYPASTITQEFKLTGYMDANGHYHETNFYKAMKYGGLFFLDEMDSCASDVLVSINGALANGYFDFPHELVFAHENFRVIAAGNTIGRGGNAAYTGRFALDISTLDRFLGVEINYSLSIEKVVAENDNDLIEFAHELRRAADENEIIILMSYRSMSKIKKLEKLDFELPKVLRMALIKGIAADDIRMLARNMNVNSSNKYYKALKQAA